MPERAFAPNSIPDQSVEWDRPVHSSATRRKIRTLFLAHPTDLLRELSTPSSEYILEFLLLPKSTNNEANSLTFRKVKAAVSLDLIFPQMCSSQLCRLF